jgi:asparagine synthase (glutamine-hydrolysing)
LRNQNEATAALDSILNDAVDIRMISDVPIGAFLSGGIDSSMIVALMQRQSSKAIKTFSIGFEDRSFDEAPHARQVAHHLGTDHTELYVSSKEIFEIIPLLPKLYDEPFGDSSQIPTYLVSRLCRPAVTVSLSGDGGDELFGGYERYTWANQYWKRVSRYPHGLRKLWAKLLRTPTLDGLYKIAEPSIPTALRIVRFEQRLATLSRLLEFKDRRSLYRGLMSHWSSSPQIVPNSIELPTVFETYSTSHSKSFLDEMMHIDLLSYLPDDIMAKVDRASMAVSLETRAPFLDHRVVEFALQLPSSWKVNGTSGKQLLKRVLTRYLPSSFFERPKMGFSIPLGSWLRSELRPWAEDLLNEKTLAKSGLLHPAPIITLWRQHISGTHNWEHHLWDILMFQSWLSNTSLSSSAEAPSL